LWRKSWRYLRETGCWCKEQQEEEETDKRKRVEKRKQRKCIKTRPILAKLNRPMLIHVLNPQMALALALPLALATTTMMMMMRGKINSFASAYSQP
jgi:vacuolar-type H+-ATPase subunit B/Vma2